MTLWPALEESRSLTDRSEVLSNSHVIFGQTVLCYILTDSSWQLRLLLELKLSLLDLKVPLDYTLFPYLLILWLCLSELPTSLLDCLGCLQALAVYAVNGDLEA